MTHSNKTEQTDVMPNACLINVCSSDIDRVVPCMFNHRELWHKSNEKCCRNKPTLAFAIKINDLPFIMLIRMGAKPNR